MSILVVAEHDNKNLNASTVSTIAAANKIGSDIDVLVAGENISAVAEQASKIRGVKRVLVADAPQFANFLAENIAQQVLTLADAYSHILFVANANGKAAAPRVAAKLGIGQISDIIGVVDSEVFKRPLYAGALIATVRSRDAKKVITVRPTAFDPEVQSETAAEITAIPAVAGSDKVKFLSRSAVKSDLPDLQNAKIVLAGGRGLANESEFEELEKLAHKMGAAVGTTRAVVDAGLAPNDWQIGQTGKIIAPDLYISFGISGAIQHIAGIKDAKVIVAVNKDLEAPIFEMADYGLVADAMTVIRELENKL